MPLSTLLCQSSTAVTCELCVHNHSSPFDVSLNLSRLCVADSNEKRKLQQLKKNSKQNSIAKVIQ